MSVLRCLLLFLFCLAHQNASCTMHFRKWIKWITTDVTYGATTVLNGSLSLIMCLRRCEDATDCVSVQVNRASNSCELSNYYPPHYSVTATPRTGWTVYYREVRQVQGIRAWMSSTYGDCSAMKAIDGQVYDYYTWSGCACTASNADNSSWIMEFQYPGTVVMATPFFRPIYVSRNTYFRLWVYKSYDDAMNDVAGVICREYTGPGIASLTNFICKQQPYGGALKIQHFLVNDGLLQFCEMKVYMV